MENSNKIFRNSKFELMRIVSMFMIVCTHVITHGAVKDNVTESTKIIIELIHCFLVVHVNSYVLVMGYFQYNKKFKIEKVFSILGQVWFYSCLITILVVSIFHLQEMNSAQYFRAISPVPYEGYWFIKIYLYVYAISPIINKFIESVERQYLKKSILIICFLNCIFPYLTRQLGYDNAEGFSLLNFCFMYMVGAYIGKYYINLPTDIANKMKKKAVLLFVVCWITNFGLNYFGSYLTGMDLRGELGRILRHNVFSYDNPFVTTMSISYFLIFLFMKDRSSQIINKISTLTFGIYLIHDNYSLNNVLYDCKRQITRL